MPFNCLRRGVAQWSLWWLSRWQMRGRPNERLHLDSYLPEAKENREVRAALCSSAIEGLF